MPTLTAKYGWQKPDPGASSNTWGTTLNGTLDAIDGQVWAINPIGTILMWAGATAPTNWALCDGSPQSTTGAYAALFAVCQYAYGGSGTTFNLPNLVQKFPRGASGAVTAANAYGGADTITLDATMVPVNAYTASQGPHSHTDNGHQHVVNLTQTTHSHNVYQDAHQHNVTGGAGVVGGSGLTPGGAEFQLSSPITDVRQPTVHCDPINANVAIQAQNGVAGSNTNIGNASLTTAQPAITVTNAAGGQPHENRPAFVQINFIVRYA